MLLRQGICVQSPVPTQWKDLTDSHRVPSDPHVCTVVQTDAHTGMHMNEQGNE